MPHKDIAAMESRIKVPLYPTLWNHGNVTNPLTMQEKYGAGISKYDVLSSAMYPKVVITHVTCHVT